jgi:hypothetical protein
VSAAVLASWQKSQRVTVFWIRKIAIDLTGDYLAA